MVLRWIRGICKSFLWRSLGRVGPRRGGMHPILFEIGNTPVPTYGVIALLAYGVSVLVMWYYARHEGLEPRKVIDSITGTIVAGLIGARLLEAIVSLDKILQNPAHLKTLIISNGVWLGGVIGAVGCGLWLFRKFEIPLLKGLDILGVIGAVSGTIARWGCWFSGCCWGSPTDLPWGVTFPEIARRLHRDLPEGSLHPTQIYMSLASLLVFGILAVFYRRKRFDGQILMLYLILYSITRFALEYVRGDAERGFVIDGVLSTSQFISIILVGVATAVYVALARRAHRIQAG